MGNRILELNEIGQSIWYDYIQRSLIETGELRKLVESGIVGVTSNPSIFEKAIAKSTDYDSRIQDLSRRSFNVLDIYEQLVIEDIKDAADILLPVYENTNGLDGFVSLEVSPELANNTNETIKEARRLFNLLNRPNVMIKVPATDAGIPAIQTLIGEGININVTLIFGLNDYQAVTDAYMKGLEIQTAKGRDISKIASVASFFVSRLDTLVDKLLKQKSSQELAGTIAVANAKVAYAKFKEIVASDRWNALASAGAQPQRVLWASTSTKNPAYKDTLYIDDLIGPNTVNTVPPSTLKLFLDHGTVRNSLEENLELAFNQLDRLGELGVDLQKVTDQLQLEGVDGFASSYRSLITSIETKRSELVVNLT